MWTRYYPIRMLFKKLASGVHHLRLNPDSKLYFLLFRIFHKLSDSIWELFQIHFPIAEAGVIIVAWILVREPAVIKQKQIEAHTGSVRNNLFQNFFVELEIGCFPIVKQRQPGSLALIDTLMISRP